MLKCVYVALFISIILTSGCSSEVNYSPYISDKIYTEVENDGALISSEIKNGQMSFFLSHIHDELSSKFGKIEREKETIKELKYDGRLKIYSSITFSFTINSIYNREEFKKIVNNPNFLLFDSTIYKCEISGIFLVEGGNIRLNDEEANLYDGRGLVPTDLANCDKFAGLVHNSAEGIWRNDFFVLSRHFGGDDPSTDRIVPAEGQNGNDR